MRLGKSINKANISTWAAESARTKARGLKQMATASYFVLAVFLALASYQVFASDPSPLQDFCVADKHSPGMYALTFINSFSSVNVLNTHHSSNSLSEFTS
jgi:hypothetical protein